MPREARQLCGTLTLGASLCLGTACLGSEAATDTSENPQIEPAALVAALELANGNTVEFYDYGDGVMIAEDGDASAGLGFQYKGERADQLTEIWSRLAPEREVPAALSALQERLMAPASSPSKKSRPAMRSRTATETAPAAPPREVSASAQGLALSQEADCPNNCCNLDFILSQFDLCHELRGDETWFEFDIPRPQQRHEEVYQWEAVVCAADDSLWDINIGDRPTETFLVPEGRSAHRVWVAEVDSTPNPFNTWYDRTISTLVNTQNEKRIGKATYCGLANIED